MTDSGVIPRPVRIQCTKNVPDECPREAVELLLIQAHPRTQWGMVPRCDVHRAADDIPMLMRVNPLAEVAIVPLPSRVMSVPMPP